MRQQNIAIIGSTSACANFVSAMLALRAKGVNVLGLCADDAKAFSEVFDNDVRRINLNELIALGEKLDIVFDLSGDDKIRSELRRSLFQSNNRHTVIAPQSFAQLMCALIDCGDDSSAPISRSAVGY